MSDYSETDSHVSIATDDLLDQLEQDATFRDDRYNRVADVLNGQWSNEDTRNLRRMGRRSRIDADVNKWTTYVSYWTISDWDPSLEVNIDGTMETAARGDAQAHMRPAILREDRENRTAYTL